MQRSSKTILWSSVIVGLALGLLMVIIAWEHNASCSIHCNGYVNWSALLGYMTFGTITSGTAFAFILRE